MILRWLSPTREKTFTERLAWWPVRAFDEYSQRHAVVWMRVVRRHRDGRITFSTFWC